jgi:hypothetical protein
VQVKVGSQSQGLRGKKMYDNNSQVQGLFYLCIRYIDILHFIMYSMPDLVHQLDVSYSN